MEIDTPGFLKWLSEARKEKGAANAEASTRTTEERIDPKPRGKGVKLPGGAVLWVDDRPLNNLFERRALASAGFFADSYTNNADALSAMRRVKYDVVISDIGRGLGRESGWDLLTEMRRAHADVPFIFYTGKTDEALRARARAAGALGVTADPAELARMVIERTSVNGRAS